MNAQLFSTVACASRYAGRRREHKNIDGFLGFVFGISLRLTTIERERAMVDVQMGEDVTRGEDYR